MLVKCGVYRLFKKRESLVPYSHFSFLSWQLLFPLIYPLALMEIGFAAPWIRKKLHEKIHPILVWREGGSESPGLRICWLVDSRNQVIRKKNCRFLCRFLKASNERLVIIQSWWNKSLFLTFHEEVLPACKLPSPFQKNADFHLNKERTPNKWKQDCLLSYYSFCLPCGALERREFE